MDRNLILAENQVLETQGLILRKISLEDVPAIYEIESNHEVTKYHEFSAHQSLEAASASIAKTFLATPLTNWGIVEKSSGKLIGTIDFFIIASKYAEFSWALNQDYWGKGYMTEAVKRLIQLCFDDLQLLVVQAKHHPANKQSGRVMEKSGMIYRGNIFGCLKGDELLLLDYYALSQEEYKEQNHA